MATFDSTFMAAIVSANPRTSPNRDELGLTRKLARFAYTLTGSEAANDVIRLGSLQTEGARVLPENCRVRFGGSGSLDLTVKLTKTDSAGANSVNLSATTSAIQAAAAVITLTAASGADTVLLGRDDILCVALPAVTTTTAGRILYFEVTYTLPAC